MISCGETGATGENVQCLYIACQSHLPAACLEFADLVRDGQDNLTADVVCTAAETHWLRRSHPNPSI